jgi:hypothetical protein
MSLRKESLRGIWPGVQIADIGRFAMVGSDVDKNVDTHEKRRRGAAA